MTSPPIPAGELEEFRAAVRKFAVDAFAAKAAYWDEKEEFPRENRELLAKLGYLGLVIPEQYGGSGLSILHATVFLEEISRVCFNTALVCQIAINGPSRAIEILGSEEQKKRLLPKCVSGEYMFGIGMSEPGAGSATTDMVTSVTPDGDGWRLNGHKVFCTGGHLATHILVFARFGKTKGAYGIGAVIVEKGMPGFTVGKPDRKMGGRGVAEAELYFDNVHIPKENVLMVGDENSTKSFRVLMSSFGPERVGNAAMCLGVAHEALELAVAYSKERHQFGRPICEFQGIQWKIADMATQIHATRLMVHHAATHLENGFPNPLAAAQAKLYANEMVQRVTNEALQIHGHYGFTRDFPLERMVRDSRGFALGGGTVEILRNTIASIVYGRSFNQRRD
ncbi:acyl-CoA dehydrogenase family protein [Extensimonas vulgaris]|uniref:Butyryl-CoA dehydrogenase n=1 Tax=Extensimonas vulgaris TaxID=1031594 RepID=A0A369AJN7_9BURK|nr:acyl-CoA dehydrogenase family protein [Extensimonas vulgaris]RCX08558.1 butyryl-CoA dehydrogenase [Extensimonas vulgaris]TWI39852.1 butyryl-CoA dehydrogenase [Extensimonas vulgaris]TXD14042.1 butyryl-CoA dehydrogenase [Extensimonas vulgaris]